MGEITCDDVLEYQDLFKLAPPFILKRMAKKNSNLVKKFEPKVREYMNNLNDDHMEKLHILLNSDIDDIQSLMNEAYTKSDKKQFKILGDPSNREFIKINIDELSKML